MGWLTRVRLLMIVSGAGSISLMTARDFSGVGTFSGIAFHTSGGTFRAAASTGHPVLYQLGPICPERQVRARSCATLSQPMGCSAVSAIPPCCQSVKSSSCESPGSGQLYVADLSALFGMRTMRSADATLLLESGGATVARIRLNPGISIE